ncbi:alpha/beta hydrolase [bacterium SCSIO 12741]|nr:alpha/beta hydrolase [bacterium SCSIO 12741]
MGFFIALTLLFIAVTAYFLYTQAPLFSGDVIRNVSFKSGFTLDFYQPTKKVHVRHPVIVFYHGGAWITGAKESINFSRYNRAVNELREKGYAIVSPNYTLARNGNSPFPNCILDAYEALTWLEQNADKYHLDLNNVGVFGESAGAHLAMVVAYISPEVFQASTHSFKIQYLVDVYGPNNLNGLYHMQTLDNLNKLLKKLPPKLQRSLDLSTRLFGFDPKTDPDRAKEIMNLYSPYYYVEEDAPPTLMIHGKKDQVVPVDQSTNLKIRLDSLGVPNEMHLLDGTNHAFIGASNHQRGQAQTWIVDFIEKRYLSFQS